MLLKLLWPTKLHRLIAKYKEEGTLNEKAVEHIKKNTLKLLIAIMLLGLLIIFIHNDSGSKYLGIAIIILSPVIVKWDIRTYLNRQITYMVEKSK